MSFGLVPSIGGDLYKLVDNGLFKFVLDKNIQKKQNQLYDKFRLGTVKMCLIFDGELTKKILLNKSIERGSLYNLLTKFFGKGIFTSNIHSRWLKQRKAILELFGPQNLIQITPELTTSMFEELDRLITIKKDLDLVTVLSLIGLVGFCKVIFRVDVTDMSEELIEPLNELLIYINGAVEPVLITADPSYRKFIANKKFVHNWMRKLIDRARKSENIREQFDDIGFDDETELIEFILSVVLGGHETTARLMLGIIYSVYHDKEIIEKLNKETDEYPNGDFFNLKKRPYLNNIIKEGTRLFPPVWLLSREAKNDIYIGNLFFKKSTQFLISPLIILRDYNVWGSNAEIFDPERFSHMDPKSQASKLYIPFIVGSENCPGKKFAILESAIVVSKLFKEYEITILEHKLNPMSAGTFRLSDKLPVSIRKIEL
ncbi:cytochrome 450-like protein [Acanthamoeba polyphaga mimivirus]|uniref:Cytochrome 450-like protein n=1 Tax=Acanthamoeba polyphaga mimivirus Kroon TaxID=3069720 RepID=A0A0G2Y6Q5_9VIRU|nr:cytochrome 450-like protein [Acanthamoeba polyphaga mimivirus]AKI80264.1 cytochrome 450-like protein [Acanthamoeba polyphaga mimivirus Kroon]